MRDRRRDDPHDPVPRPDERGQRDRALGALVGLPRRPEIPAVREVRVLRDPQQRRALRLVAAVQVPDPRPGRRGVPRRRPRPRHPDVRRRPRPVHRLARRRRVRRRGRRRSSGRRRTTTSSPAPSRTSPTSRTSSAAPTGRDRGRQRGLGASWRSRARGRARSSPRSRPACERSRTSACATRRSPVAGHDLADRLHRRPRLRDLGPRRATRSTVWDAVAEASAGHGVIPFGMIALYMARIEAGLLLLDVDFAFEPLRLDGRRPLDPDRARARLDGPRPRRPTIGRSSAGPRSSASCATRRRAGS